MTHYFELFKITYPDSKVFLYADITDLEDIKRVAQGYGEIVHLDDWDGMEVSYNDFCRDYEIWKKRPPTVKAVDRFMALL